MFKTIKWNTGSAAARFRHTRKKIEENRKKNKAASSQARKRVDSPQALGYYKICTNTKLKKSPEA